MYKYLFFIWGLFFFSGCKSDTVVDQTQQSSLNKNDYKVNVETMPMPVGGIEAILAKVVYPPEAKEKGIQGKVMVQAFVDENGKVMRAEILKGAEWHLDKAALDAITQVSFTPGVQDGKKVKTQIVIPVVFKLDGDGQKKTEGEFKKKGDYYFNAPVMPEIAGGVQELIKKIVYPEAEKKAGTQGKVYIEVYIDEKGNIEKKQVVEGVNRNLDKAALDALNGIKFTPGKVNGKPVKTVITLPIVFRLQ